MVAREQASHLRLKRALLILKIYQRIEVAREQASHLRLKLTDQVMPLLCLASWRGNRLRICD